MKAVFIHTWGGPQYASTIKPILEEMRQRGHNVKWGNYSDEADVFIYTNAPWEEDRLRSVRKHDYWHPHGLGAEYVGSKDYVEKLDFMLCRGPMQQEKYVKEYPQWSWKFRIVGYPKNDLMWKKEGWEKALCLSKKLALSQPTITFTGTYDFAFSSSEEWMRTEEAVFETLNQLEGVDLIFKPNVISVAYNRTHKLGFFKRLMEKYPKVKWIDPKYSDCPSPYLRTLDILPDGDITPLLMVTDVLVADDYSGVLNEFLPLDRPFVKLCREIDKVEHRAGLVCPFGLECDVKNLHEQLLRSIANPKEFSVERKEWLAKVMYKPDGYASSRAVDVIEETMK